jgi:hypothetical protein
MVHGEVDLSSLKERYNAGGGLSRFVSETFYYLKLEGLPTYFTMMDPAEDQIEEPSTKLKGLGGGRASFIDIYWTRSMWFATRDVVGRQLQAGQSLQ